MKVIKFGGTSVQNADAIKLIKEIIQVESEKIIVVVSALAGITNKLDKIFNEILNSRFKEAKFLSAEIKFIHINLANELFVDNTDYIEKIYFSLISIIDSVICLGKPSLKVKDMILSLGELLSSYIIYSYLRRFGFNIELADPRDILKTNSDFTNAEIDDFASSISVKSVILPLLERYDIVITGGFIGSDSNNQTTTLGRGGSDYSASVIGKYINAGLIEIWTDVDGIMTADPSIVNDSMIVKTLNYKEALDISLSGGKVIHYKTIFPVIDNMIPIAIRNTFNIESKGTIIKSDSKEENSIKSVVVEKGFTFTNIKIIKYYTKEYLQFIVYDLIKKANINVLLVDISNSEVKLIIRETDNLNFIQSEFEKIGILNIHQNQAIISIVGNGIFGNQKAIESITEVVENHEFKINNILISNTNIRIIINESEIEVTVKAVHKKIFS